MTNYEKVAHRRAKKVLRVVDSQGMPIKSTTLQLKQTNHKFLFGWGSFDFNAYFSTEDPEKKAFFKERMDIWMKLFNYGTLPFYLGGYEPVEGKPNWESRMAAATYMKEHDIKAKGHPLCWHTACANWLMEYDNSTILKKQLQRIERDVTQFKGTVDIWDVINEVVIMPVFDKYDNAITRICKEYGRVELVKKVFEEAKAANPDAMLLLNDFNTSEKYAELIDDQEIINYLPRASLTRSAKLSALSAAPPIRPPSISFCATSSRALEAFMLPPYWIRTFSATSSPNMAAISLRICA